MADETNPVEQPEVSRNPPKPPSSVLTVISLLGILIGCLLEWHQTAISPRPLRVLLAIAYSFAAILTARYATRRTFLAISPPARWEKNDPKLLRARVVGVFVLLLLMGFVAGNLISSAGTTWKTLADDAFPWLFMTTCQPDFLTERLPLPPPWPQTPIGKFWISLRRLFSARRQKATQL
jgi:hypothetical protein